MTEIDFSPLHAGPNPLLVAQRRYESTEPEEGFLVFDLLTLRAWFEPCDPFDPFYGFGGERTLIWAIDARAERQNLLDLTEVVKPLLGRIAEGRELAPTVGPHWQGWTCKLTPDAKDAQDTIERVVGALPRAMGLLEYQSLPAAA